MRRRPIKVVPAGERVSGALLGRGRLSLRRGIHRSLALLLSRPQAAARGILSEGFESGGAATTGKALVYGEIPLERRAGKRTLGTCLRGRTRRRLGAHVAPVFRCGTIRTAKTGAGGGHGGSLGSVRPVNQGRRNTQAVWSPPGIRVYSRAESTWRRIQRTRHVARVGAVRGCRRDRVRLGLGRRRGDGTGRWGVRRGNRSAERGGDVVVCQLGGRVRGGWWWRRL